MDIEGNLGAYLGGREPTARYASFDYCFNYFQGHREQSRLAELTHGDALQLSCLHLGFYLASWGMLRGSADLLQRSAKVFVPIIDIVSKAPSDLWEMDADSYDERRCRIALKTARLIEEALPGGASQILSTKIMLGTFGCVPAFDTNFKKGFRASTFGPKALRRVGEFYASNADVIERHRVHTLDFATGLPTSRRYTRAKVIDMIFFIEGGPAGGLGDSRLGGNPAPGRPVVL